MTLKECKSIAKKMVQINLADDLIYAYKLESGIFEWNFDILDVVISFGYVKGLSFDDLMRLIGK